MTTPANNLPSQRVHDLLDVVDELLTDNQKVGPRFTLYLPAAEPAQLSSMLSNARKVVRETVEHTSGLDDGVKEGILKQIEAALENEDDFKPCHSTAIFTEEQTTRVFRVDAGFELKSHLGQRWILTPLLEMAANVDAFLLLQLSLNRIRLYRGSRLGIRDITPDTMPTSFDDSAVAASKLGGDDPDADGPNSPDKLMLAKFFEEIDNAVFAATEKLQGPLILAGVDFYLPIYEEMTKHPGFSGKIIAGNHDHTSADELRELAFNELHSELIESRKKQLLRFRELDGQGRLETDPDQALNAAYQGRVKSIVLPSDRARWGRFDSETGKVEITSEHEVGSCELFQLTAECALQHGGEIFYLEHSKMLSATLLRRSCATETSNV